MSDNVIKQLKDELNYPHIVGVINNVGSVNIGHYTANCWHPDHGWLRCDDHSCYLMRLDEVINSEAYVLFFLRI